MTTSAWSETEGPAARRGVPPWVWWSCGSGCLLALVAVISLVAFGVGLAREFRDPERAWKGVAELVPHDQRPEGWEAHGIARFGLAFYFLTPPSEDALVIVQRARDAAEVELLLSRDAPAHPGWTWAVDDVEDRELGTIELQGRETRCLRFQGRLSGRFARVDVGEASGLLVDLSGSGPPTLLHLIAVPPEGRTLDEHARELLAPFDLWRGR